MGQKAFMVGFFFSIGCCLAWTEGLKLVWNMGSFAWGCLHGYLSGISCSDIGGYTWMIEYLLGHAGVVNLFLRMGSSFVPSFLSGLYPRIMITTFNPPPPLSPYCSIPSFSSGKTFIPIITLHSGIINHHLYNRYQNIDTSRNT